MLKPEMLWQGDLCLQNGHCGENGTINLNYLINIIHFQASLVITPARASGTAVEKRDSANLSFL